MPVEPASPLDTPASAPRHGMPDLRVRRATVLTLLELDPRQVVDGELTQAGVDAPAVMPVGRMRETCPHCGVPLQLVLRYKHVIRSHLYCDQCTRCFDAVYASGRSALALTGLSID